MFGMSSRRLTASFRSFSSLFSFRRSSMRLSTIAHMASASSSSFASLLGFCCCVPASAPPSSPMNGSNCPSGFSSASDSTGRSGAGMDGPTSDLVWNPAAPRPTPGT